MAETTRVIGLARRPVGFDAFADITATPLVDILPTARGRVQLIFGGTLTTAETDAIWDRLTSIDDTDLAERANLKALMETVRTQAVQTPVTRLVVALARRTLQADDNP